MREWFTDDSSQESFPALTIRKVQDRYNSMGHIVHEAQKLRDIFHPYTGVRHVFRLRSPMSGMSNSALFRSDKKMDTTHESPMVLTYDKSDTSRHTSMPPDSKTRSSVASFRPQT